MMDIDEKQLAAAVDHTLLTPEATADDVRRLCSEAVEFGFAAACVNPRWISLAADLLNGKAPGVAGVVSLPLGADTTDIKVAQTNKAIFAGADEIDMVADLASIVEGDERYLFTEISAVAAQCREMKPAVILKVIIESAALTDEQIVFACRIAQAAGADYVKTSTGLHPAGGATVEAVRLMVESAPACKVKAAGRIRTAAQALEMLEAGASRIGTSRGVDIIREFMATHER